MRIPSSPSPQEVWAGEAWLKHLHGVWISFEDKCCGTRFDGTACYPQAWLGKAIAMLTHRKVNSHF